jgi:hypothetical protein
MKNRLLYAATCIVLGMIQPTIARADAVEYTVTMLPASNVTGTATYIDSAGYPSLPITATYAVSSSTDFTNIGNGLDYGPMLYFQFSQVNTVDELVAVFTNGFEAPTDEFAAADLITPGTYTGDFGNELLTVAPVSVPEPGSLSLLVIGLAGLGFVLRHRMREA